MQNFIIFGLLVILLVAAQFTSRSSVEDIIEEYEKARGGRDNLNAVKNIFMEGRRKVNELESKISILQEKGKLARADFEMNGQQGFAAVTKNEALVYLPLQMASPNFFSDDMQKYLQHEMDTAGPLVDYISKGYKAVLQGKERVDESLCYKIILTISTGYQVKYWIELSTFRLIQSSTVYGGLLSCESFGKATSEIVILYKDFFEQQGMIFPHHLQISNAAGGIDSEIIFDKIEINKEVDEKFYQHESIV